MTTTTVLIDDLGDFINAVVNGIEFTADKASRDWGLRPEDDAEALKDAAARAGVSTGEFWAHFEPLLNEAAGWA